MKVAPGRKHGDAADGGALGAGVPRLDGPLKVSGAAPYALDYFLEDILHCVLVQANVGAGRVAGVDRTLAESCPGVRLVLDATNSPRLVNVADFFGNRTPGEDYSPFATHVRYNGELAAAVVADTLEQAQEAALRVRVDIERSEVIATYDDARAGTGVLLPATKDRGDAAAMIAAAPVTVVAAYETPREYNVPIEPHGLIAHWEGADHLTIYEPTQWVDGTARHYAEWFGLPFENVRIVSPYVGGGFGSKSHPFPYCAVAAIAARQLRRPVKLAVTRAQTFTALGGRPATRQVLRIGATRDGEILAIDHEAANETAIEGQFVEPLNSIAAMLYAAPGFRSRQHVVPVNTVKPGAMRAPGKTPSAFALECAMDELAVQLEMDPVELRLRNEPEVDPETGKKWSSRRLREALQAGAAAFGWARRDPRPRSFRDGRDLVGWGMACGAHPVNSSPGEAVVKVYADGSVEILSSAIDMGTGTYTILAQTAAEVLGISAARVSTRLGDSRLPRAPIAGGSQLANLMTSAVHLAAIAARDELISLGLTHPNSPLRGQANTLVLANGVIAAPNGPEVTIADLMTATGQHVIEAKRDTLPPADRSASEKLRMFNTPAGMERGANLPKSRHSFCAHFVEVRVDEDFGTIRVARVTSAFDAGRLYNPTLADSQFKGGIVMGIGMALMEEGVVDPRTGRVLNANLADYRIPTNADVPDIETISVGQPDFDATPLGGKAVGELSIVGLAPAIANAVYHATGKRLRRLPLALTDLL